MTIDKSLAAENIGIKTIKTKDLVPNPHNPRVLFDKEPMKVLQESIKRVGILVPLTVFFEKKKDRYVILDGQRRWTCAMTLDLDEVPVNVVAQPTLVQNIVTMFQIHKLREDWELMPTALKVELLMSELKDKNDARLAELTGLDVAVIVRCKKLLSFDRKFQDRMLDPNPDKRMKADFFIELYPVIHDREVTKFPWFKERHFIEQMILKYHDEARTIKAVTDFRLVKQHITYAKRAHRVKQLSIRLQKFVDEITTPISYLEIEPASVRAEAKAFTKKLATIENALTDLDVEKFYGEEELWQTLSRLAKIIQAKLEEADKQR